MMFPEQRQKAIRHLGQIYQQHLNNNHYETQRKFNDWMFTGFAGVGSFSDSKIIKELNCFAHAQREGRAGAYYHQMYEVEQLLVDIEIDRMLT